MTNAELFDDPAELLFKSKFEPKDPPRRRPKELLEAQRERLLLLMRQGSTTRIGPNGATVFKGPAYDSQGGAA
jgi:hypothetical protein